MQDAAGNPLATDFSWSFTTAPDTTPPQVSSVSPPNLASDVNPDANLTATFNEAMDPATISTSSFELRDPANALLPATVSYDTTTQTASLDPTNTLAN